jgi:tRNA A37 threonylcarbamoyladenosine synthetase subunit TsaC/SUA5/YrdC
VPASNIGDARKYFGNKIDGYYGSKKKVGKPSTIISLVGNKPKIVRQGVKKVSLTSF